MREIILPLNVHEYIQINFPYNLHQCDEINIVFRETTQQLLLLDEFIYDTINHTIVRLKKVLNKQLYLHLSITKDIGYLWNQEMHAPPTLNFSDQYDWIGLSYLLWCPPGNVRPQTTTWLYNDNQGKIIFEVTPDYPWHFVDPDPDEDFISYEDFMKQYQPYVVRTLSTDTVQQWIKQLEVVSKEIKKNTERYDRLHQYESE